MTSCIAIKDVLEGIGLDGYRVRRSVHATFLAHDHGAIDDDAFYGLAFFWHATTDSSSCAELAGSPGSPNHSRQAERAHLSWHDLCWRGKDPRTLPDEKRER